MRPLGNLRFTLERPEFRWGPPMLCSRFVGGGNFEQERFVEWTGEKFHGNGRLIGLGTLQATAVGIIGVGHTVVDFASKTSGHHNGREAADGAKIHAPAATCAAPK